MKDWFNERENKFENLAELESEIEHLEIWQEKTLEIQPAKAVDFCYNSEEIYRNQRGLYLEAFSFTLKKHCIYTEKKS